MAVCHSRYCIKTIKPILKRFWPSGSPIIEAFGTPYANTKIPRGTPSLGYMYTGVGTRSSADADKPARCVWRSVKVIKHSTIPYVRYSFMFCNSNFVFKTHHFYNIRLQKMSWPWNGVKGHSRSLRVVSFDRLCMVSY